ncbi:PKD domain-containing protein [Flavivirga algicola]|uniref:PKD domain-containing protein n=1 Tax=Flavivirga algicola TaxID=2729136 RepID=A0ABX1RW70_9FLAO|nr:PKD domain-containing protein [Flavivirga algicola]NMH87245.1 PKD domain-containing protein [Flavivirga algicola]
MKFKTIKKTAKFTVFLFIVCLVGCVTDDPVMEDPDGNTPGEDPPPTENTNISTTLKASRLSGPAPLAVQFDAIGTTHENDDLDTYRELGYHFTFDDPTSGTWKHSGKSKNSQIGGPIAAHVFETPGTYTVRVRAQDSAGNFDDESVIIVVTDPDTVFSGEKTVVISKTGNTSGAPSGAQLLTNQTSWPQWESGKRYLLMAGQDFSSFGDIRIYKNENIQVGKIGSGADPIVKQVNVDRGTAPSNWSKGVVISDLNSERVTIPNSSEDVYVIRGSNGGISIGSSVKHWVVEKGNDDLIWPENIFIYESRGVGAWVLSRGLNILGVEMSDPREHNIRTAYLVKAFIAHNLLYRAARTKHNIKIHAEGILENENERLVKNSLSSATRWVVVANNTMGNGEPQPNGWAMTVCAENGNKVQGVHDVIVENNNFASQYNVEVILGGARLTERGNTSIEEYKLKLSNSVHQLPASWDGPYFTDAEQIIPEAPGL